MAKNKNIIINRLEELAKIAESLQDLYRGKATIIFELEQEEYTQTISHFREIDRHHKQFSIDISGSEFHFILNEPEKS